MSNQKDTQAPSSSIKVVDADLSLPRHQTAVLDLINSYSKDSMGNAAPLNPGVRKNLIAGLRSHPTTKVYLAYDGNDAVGVAVCFLGFSTFAAKPLLNIHDFAILPSHRGKGIARIMLEVIEEKARQMGCCKLTLEVLENNHRAMKVYHAAGFDRAVYSGEGGRALFYDKKLKC